ncbi:alkyl sulfatase dimerization domain-containing protein [Clostridium sp.]|uniref:alkyl/aryl-sulfatase n=1 Tax=Clostridium sp. TaxID=1506 RepID=UPI002850FAC1|nr:alkyl sulfatase dimerization domain-containing protein [Clostridium sp.]MDR3597390.1 alkyl sulfatase dimerization domain-containing protein [Clostridium sp.]
MKSENEEKQEEIVCDIEKNASRRTTLINREAFKKMNWGKIKIESNLVKKGMVANAGLIVIKGENHNSIPVWDLNKYAFLLKDSIPCTVNPKLWIQGKLNLHAGLFKITDNIYQIRGFDVANMTFVKGKTGWIIIDCLTCKETAKAALQFTNNYFGKLIISAVIITHSHTDHYGGIEAVMNYFINKDVKIYVPENYVNSVIEENVTAGVAMARRSIYQYGNILPHGEKGQLDIGIGKGISIGTVTFTENVQEITDKLTRKRIDGVNMEFLLALETEAPAEMFVYIPSEHSLCIAEDANATMHNLYTLRGAKVRDAVAWAQSIQNAIDLWGWNLTSVFGVHNWPRFGKADSIDYLERQRDIYQYINDQTLRLINQGYTIDDIGRMVKLPESLAGEWYNSQFYGTVNHNAKAVYQRYMGWYDSNPVDLNKLLPQDSAKKYVEYMGGEDRVLRKAKESFENEEYQWVAEVTKQLIYANPNNREAKFLCADALEQLGYVQESGTWRNEYLMGAQELRIGVIQPRAAIISEDVLNNIPLGNVLHLLSIRINGVEAGDFDYKINFIIPDRNNKASTQIKRGIFRYLNDKLSKDAAVTVNMPKDVLYELVSTNDKPDISKMKIEGDASKWYAFLELRENINHAFNIVTPVSR